MSTRDPADNAIPIGGFLFLIPVVSTHDLTFVARSLSMTFFCVELVVAPMNFGFGMAGIISPLFSAMQST